MFGVAQGVVPHLLTWGEKRRNRRRKKKKKFFGVLKVPSEHLTEL